MEIIHRNIDSIKELCDKNKVKSLFAFGSVVGNSFTEQSDVDLVVDIAESDPLQYSDRYFDLKFSLEQLFGRKVDLLETRAIRNRFLEERIDQTKVLVYGT